MSRFRAAVSALVLGCPLIAAGQTVGSEFEYSPSTKVTADSGFAAYKKAQLDGFSSYKEQVQKEFREYAQLHRKVSDEYQKRIAEIWAVPEQSSKTRWVQYEDGYQRKRVVDFENGVVTWSSPEAIPGAMNEVEKRAEAMLAELMSVTRKDAFEQDEVAREVEAESRRQFQHLETAELDASPVLPAYLFGDGSVDEATRDRAIAAMAAGGQRSTASEEGQKVVTWSFPLTAGTTDTETQAEPASQPIAAKTEEKPATEPKAQPAAPVETETETASVTSPPEAQPSITPEGSSSVVVVPRPVWQTRTVAAAQAQQLPARARPFVAAINRENSEFELSAELLLAIMETESAFNPMAKSPIPAFGLMQIVPASAGQDATAKLFGKARLLAPSYLYNAENNIRVGAAYFNILYYRYFRGIDDPLTRLYCSIAAYNTGPGNVSKALTGTSMALKPAIRVANTMSPDEVYEHLLTNLPYAETVNYLRKVTSRLASYEEALADG